MEKEPNKMLNQEETAAPTKEANEFSSLSPIVKISPEYSKLVNPLPNAEYELLKESISNKGLHLPIIINQDSVILDGQID